MEHVKKVAKGVIIILLPVAYISGTIHENWRHTNTFHVRHVGDTEIYATSIQKKRERSHVPIYNVGRQQGSDTRHVRWNSLPLMPEFHIAAYWSVYLKISTVVQQVWILLVSLSTDLYSLFSTNSVNRDDSKHRWEIHSTSAQSQCNQISHTMYAFMQFWKKQFQRIIMHYIHWMIHSITFTMQWMTET